MSTGTGNFWTGRQGSFSQQSRLAPGQQGLQSQLQNAGMGSGAGGAFGGAADYYRSLLGGGGDTFDQMAAPEMRQFNQDIIPGLSEQFAGMGSGGLSSSGFRNAAVNAGTDLSERLGAIRAQLRQQGAAGLAGIGQQGLQPTVENLYTQGQGGFLDQLPGIAQGIASGMSGNVGRGISALSGLFGQNKQAPNAAPVAPPRPQNLAGYKQPEAWNHYNAPQFGQR